MSINNMLQGVKIIVPEALYDDREILLKLYMDMDRIATEGRGCDDSLTIFELKMIELMCSNLEFSAEEDRKEFFFEMEVFYRTQRVDGLCDDFIPLIVSFVVQMILLMKDKLKIVVFQQIEGEIQQAVAVGIIDKEFREFKESDLESQIQFVNGEKNECFEQDIVWRPSNKETRIDLENLQTISTLTAATPNDFDFRIERISGISAEAGGEPLSKWMEVDQLLLMRLLSKAWNVAVYGELVKKLNSRLRSRLKRATPYWQEENMINLDYLKFFSPRMEVIEGNIMQHLDMHMSEMKRCDRDSYLLYFETVKDEILPSEIAAMFYLYELSRGKKYDLVLKKFAYAGFKLKKSRVRQRYWKKLNSLLVGCGVLQILNLATLLVHSSASEMKVKMKQVTAPVDELD